MQCTPEPNLFPETRKSHHCHDCIDSGYSGVFQSPWSITNSCGALSPPETIETPKENLKLPVTPKERSKEPARSSPKGSRGPQRPPAAGNWCDTPKICRRDGLLRHRLVMSRPNPEVKTERRVKGSFGNHSERWLSASLESLDIMREERDEEISGRKRRLLFAQMRTSTVDDDKLDSGQLPSFERTVALTEADFESISAREELDPETPSSSCKENSGPLVSSDATNLYDSCSAPCTPSSTNTPTYIRSVSEDSGFGSLDKSQDSSVDHDGSFRELLRSASKGTGETFHPAEAKWRPRLQRQHRLSTLKEGGSQSEEDLADRKLLHPSREEEVFTDNDAPSSPLSLTCENVCASAKPDGITPQKAATSENKTPYSAPLSTSDVTPSRTTPADLSLTPALQLIHAMCQQNAQSFQPHSPSLKEHIKTSAALADTPMTFRTTMPLAGLIGRKMGIGKVDILTELRKRNLRHVLFVILRMLDTQSIHSFGQVCKSWNQIIQQDKKARLRRRSHLKDLEASLEQGAPAQVSEPDTRALLPRRSALKLVQSQSRSSSYCTPQSASSTFTPLSQHSSHSLSSSSSKRNKFLEVAKTLFSDECLKPCPRCEFPARCHSVKREGVCSRDDCGFQFCTSCLCAYHSSRACGSQSAGRRKTDTRYPGSAESKRNIRRL